MFKWIKIHGCNCHPLERGSEKYIINVGDIWGGIVQSHPCEYEPGKFTWESWYTVFGQKVSGQSGGTFTRDDSMEWIEKRIADALSQIRSVQDNPTRTIFDCLWQTNEETGEDFQEILD